MVEKLSRYVDILHMGKFCGIANKPDMRFQYSWCFLLLDLLPKGWGYKMLFSSIFYRTIAIKGREVYWSEQTHFLELEIW